MSDAAAAREARRKAILSRGSDRLNKLASTARGEDYVATFSKQGMYICANLSFFLADYRTLEQPARNAPTADAFLGEESVMPSPAARATPSPAPIPPTASNGGPSAWTTEQQQEFIRALMNAPEQAAQRSIASEPTASQAGAGLNADAGDDPMAAMLNALTQMTGQGVPSGFGDIPGMPPMPGADIPVTPTRNLFVKLRPLLHLLASWILLAFFALKMEPEAYADQNHTTAIPPGMLERWARLAWRAPEDFFAVRAVVSIVWLVAILQYRAYNLFQPFFWAFTTLQLVLHSAEILTKSVSQPQE